MRIQYYPHVKVNQPKFSPVLQSFRQLEDLLRDRPHEGAKGDAPLWAPQEFYEGFPQVRQAENIARLSAAVLDVDDLDVRDWRRVVVPSLTGREAIVHNSFSSWKSEDKVRARVILSLDRPVEADEWPELRDRIRLLLGIPWAAPKRGIGGVDRIAGSVATAYYVWSWPPGYGPRAWLEYLPGVPLCVSDLLASDKARLDAPRARTTSVLALADKMRRSRNERRSSLGSSLRALVRGEPYAEEGERDETVWLLAGTLAREFLGSSEAEICALFSDSTRAMVGQPGAPTPSQIADKVARQVAARATDEPEGDPVRDRWRACLERAGRARPYSEDELDALAESAGLPRASLSSAWVLQHGPGYYLLSERGYVGPYTGSEVPERAEIVLAPAETDGVQVTCLRGGKLARAKPADLVAASGRVLDGVVYSLSRQESALLERDGRSVLCLASCPLRQIEPRHEPEIERWLELLGGEVSEHLLDWVACITLLDEPIQALFLEGSPGSGKSMLARGLARLWTEGGPTSLDDAMGRFNDRLLTCPLAFGDERVPVERGLPRIDELKAEISCRSRRLEIKYQKVADMEGAIRVLLAANNRELLLSGADLTAHDVEALLARLIHVPVGRAATEYLESLDPRTIESWVEGDRIAAHALWLRDNRQVERGARFLIRRAPNVGLRSLATDSGLRAAICHWVTLWLTSDRPGPNPRVRCEDGEVWVSARGLHESWQDHDVSVPRTPSLSRLCEALEPLTARRTVMEVGGSRLSFHVLDLSQVESWAEAKGFALAEDVRRHAREKSNKTLDIGKRSA